MTNTKKEMSGQASVAHGDQEYSVKTGVQMNIVDNDKNYKLQVTMETMNTINGLISSLILFRYVV
jgi:hypothetical protein